MIDVSLDPPWLTARLPTPHRMLSWAPHNPGFVTADTVIWREVRDADLTEDFDALSWLRDSLIRAGRGRVRRPPHVPRSGPISSRNRMFGSNFRQLSRDRRASRMPSAWALRQRPVQTRPGTINLLAVTDAALDDTALIELSSIAAEARTAAVIDHGPDLPTGRATGTGTDCIVVAAPPGTEAFAGLHTEVARPSAPPSTPPWREACAHGWPSRKVNPGCPERDVLLHGAP
jgi:adenosylcobinamide amidohydrolase